MSKYASPLSSSSGLTLLEMLVVMIITSLVAALLMQAFASMLDMRGRLLTHVEYQDHAARSTRWFRESVRGLVAELPAPDRQQRLFSGTPQGFRGTSVAGPDLAAGTTQLIEWRLEAGKKGRQLVYLGEFDHRFVILKLNIDSTAFYYMDGKGSWHSHWPPQQLRDNSPQLPRAVRLQGYYRNEPLLWLAAVPAQPNPRRALLPVEQLGL